MRAVELIGPNQPEFTRKLKKYPGCRNVTQQGVSRWANKKYPCKYITPPHCAPYIEELTGGKVTKQELCPAFPWNYKRDPKKKSLVKKTTAHRAAFKRKV